MRYVHKQLLLTNLLIAYDKSKSQEGTTRARIDLLETVAEVAMHKRRRLKRH